MRERLRRPLELELRSGCRDTVVVGGLEKLLATVGTPFSDVREVMAGYAELAPAERGQRIEQALAILAAGAEHEASRIRGAARSGRATRGEPSPTTGSSRADASGDDLNDRELLDHEISDGPLDLGRQAGKKLGEIGLATYRDLLYCFPRRYEDRRALPDIAAVAARAEIGESVTVIGTVTGRKAVRSRRGMVVLRAFLEDGAGGRVTAVWFNQPWLEKQLFPGQRIIVTGKPKRSGARLELSVTAFEIDDDSESLSTDRIVAIYPSTQGLSQAYVRRATRRLLDRLGTIAEHLPRTVIERHGLVTLDEALRTVHFPKDEEQLAMAIRRLKFDEFLFLELRVLRNRDPSLAGRAFAVDPGAIERFLDSLPFRLTGAQQNALAEISADMREPRQMARLLQGDVGSGKTVVAAAALYAAIDEGAQAALMAPTEILARQHFLNLTHYLYPLGVRSELLLGTMTASQRKAARERVRTGEADLVVGTQALIQEGVEFRDLGIAVIDEEHRFGVAQRRKLLQGLPDVLVMSATPIPRSLALTLYGDLELTTIDELPPGRKPIQTRLVDARKRAEVYRFAWEQIREGRQVYLVTPLIEESEALDGIVSTTQMFADLQAIMPAACRIEMLHGKMGGADKESVMGRFRAHQFDLLVSTTVIEVGVDVANASVMIIENAERFGLSQLHQLRGRVGRGPYESHCILVAGDRSRKTQRRLDVVAKHSDGFVIAQKDLELRGPGELRGTRQSGLGDLQLGDVALDGTIIEEARELALQILAADPQLEQAWSQRIRDELVRRSQALGLRQII